MSIFSYTRAQSATNQSASVLGFLKKLNSSSLALKLKSQIKGTNGSTILFIFIAWLALTLMEKLIRALFAPKTRIGIERNPYYKEPNMLRFIKKTIKLTLGAFIGLMLMLFLAFTAIVILLIQLIAHAPM